MATSDYVEQDNLWSAIQQAFSPEEAIYFRSYPVVTNHTVRELDYLLYHRSGALSVILTVNTNEEELIIDQDFGGFTEYDTFSGERRTYHPTSVARNFLFGLRMLLERQQITVNHEFIFIWLPNISPNSRYGSFLRDTDSNNNVHFLFGQDVQANDLRYQIRNTLDDRRIDLAEWARIREKLNPASPIQLLTPRLSRTQQLRKAKKLSKKYFDEHRKSTLIFLSYRRDNSGWAAGRIYGHLQQVFNGNIFFDYDSIKPGSHWLNAIDQALDDCIVQIVVIGQDWATLTKPGASQPRIMESGDMVAHEVRVALRKKVITIPLLIDGGPMPQKQELPWGLKKLPMRNGVNLTQDNFFAKMDVIVDRIIELLEMAINP
jgi:hypothetical protein